MAPRCSACSHPEVSRLNERLHGGAEVLLPPLAREFGLTRFALMRHRDRHLDRGATAAPVVTEDVLGDPARVADHAAKARLAIASDERVVRAGVRIDSRKSTRAGRRAVPADAKQRFLEEFALSGNVSQSAGVAGVGRKQVYRWQEHDEAFALAFREAETEAVEALEAVARERAVTGSKLVRKVYRHGRLIEEVVEVRPSDPMLIKLLQALRPEKYGDKLAVTQTQIVKTIDAEAWDSV